jgi:hypothetical protein
MVLHYLYLQFGKKLSLVYAKTETEITYLAYLY